MENLGVDLNERDGDPKFYWDLTSLPGHPGISKDQAFHPEPVHASLLPASVEQVRFASSSWHSWRQQARLMTYRMLAWQDCCLSLGWPGSQRRETRERGCRRRPWLTHLIPTTYWTASDSSVGKPDKNQNQATQSSWNLKGVSSFGGKKKCACSSLLKIIFKIKINLLLFIIISLLKKMWHWISQSFYYC